ncbi:kinase-like protein [Heliocybe sulcata]|uniref:Kinase-like protein n=1 Tax=Heliocybe sulcata TaxID=5364 RepID=A0A5C3N1D0_9AGAM|nr:kinase-like protein [Heliocybe sulcata]
MATRSIAIGRVPSPNAERKSVTDLTDQIIDFGPKFAEGGQSDVYAASLPRPGGTVERVAIKVLRGIPDDEQDNENIKRNDLTYDFASESTCRVTWLWQSLKHANALAFYGVYRKDGITSGLVVPRCECDISRYLKINPDAHKVKLLLGAAEGAIYLHANDVVHGDIKPVWYFLSRSLSWWRLMRSRHCSATFSSKMKLLPWLTSTPLESLALKASLLTCRYASPEVLLSEEPDEPQTSEYLSETNLTPKSDVYSLAMSILEILDGTMPFPKQRSDPTAILCIGSGKRPTREEHGNMARLPYDIWPFLEKCWDKEPTERPEMSEVISAALNPLLSAGVL